jgi:hypothetical protein
MFLILQVRTSKRSTAVRAAHCRSGRANAQQVQLPSRRTLAGRRMAASDRSAMRSLTQSWARYAAAATFDKFFSAPSRCARRVSTSEPRGASAAAATVTFEASVRGGVCSILLTGPHADLTPLCAKNWNGIRGAGHVESTKQFQVPRTEGDLANETSESGRRSLVQHCFCE